MAKSKNDPTARGAKSGIKTYDGKKVKPVKLVGGLAGQGNIIAAQYEDNGDLVTDANGNPIPWASI